MGNIDVIVNVLFGIYEILQAFFSGDLTLLRALFSRLSLFNFQGPFASRSRGQLIQYITSLSLCQEVFQNFFEFFILSFLLQALLSACRLFDSLSIISLRAPFVKRFFLTFSSFYSLFSLFTLFRDTALSSVHLFYHFLSPLSTLFCLFLPPSRQLRCFAHFLILFIPFFAHLSFFGFFVVFYCVFTDILTLHFLTTTYWGYLHF